MNERIGIPILIPKEMVNDDAYLVSVFLADPGDRVEEEQPLAELETSKAAFTLASPAEGYFYPHFREGDMVKVGEVFGTIRDTPADAQPLPTHPQSDHGPATPDPRFSLPAWEEFLASGLPLDAFAGMAHVKRQDIRAKLGAATPALFVPIDFSNLSDREKAEGVVLLGGGGHARECIEILELCGAPPILGVVDTRAPAGSRVAGYPVLGGNDTLPRLVAAGVRNLVLAYGISGHHPDRGAHFRRLLEEGHLFPAIVHPKAAVNRSARLGRAAQVMGGSLIGSECVVGDACIINSNAVVSHDCVLAANVHVAPGAILAGGVRVGEDTVVGMGATVYMRARIGAGVIVHNGANIFADVPDGVVVRGDWRGEKDSSS